MLQKYQFGIIRLEGMTTILSAQVSMGSHDEEAHGAERTKEHEQKEEPVRLGEWRQPGPG